MADLVTPDIVPNPVTPLGWDGTDFHALGVDVNGVLHILAGHDGATWMPLTTDGAGRLEVIAGFDGTNFVQLRTDAAGHLEVDVGHDDAGYAPLKAMDVAGETYQVLANTVADRVLTIQNLTYVAHVAAHAKTLRQAYTIPAGYYGILSMYNGWIDAPADGFAVMYMHVGGQEAVHHLTFNGSPPAELTMNLQPNILLPTGAVVEMYTRHTASANLSFRVYCMIHRFPIV